MNDLILFDDNAFTQGPTKYSVENTPVDGDDTFESESGETNSNVIRQNKHKIPLEYVNLTSEELGVLMSYINVEKIKVDYYYGEMNTGYFKANSINTSMILNEKDGYGTINNAYWNISFTLEEF